jgi:GntR family transcriptional regulator
VKGIAMSRQPAVPAVPGLKYIQVADRIAARIRSGELPAGQKIPAERVLAAGYGVSYETIRRATQRLREDGLIVTIHGRGNFAVMPESRPQPRETSWVPRIAG